ncbi:MAG: tryptophan-rich sensory protein [Actinomycetota bacterium]|jgi:tryptophan-rich sensory protein|nr:tryptophan-rich sensory protein [Actinomycetota bacterium]
METSNYYKKLKKPIWAPPGRLFGPVWTGLYIIIFVSFGYVVYLYIKNIIPFIVLLPFILNLIFNFTFTPIQFRLKNNWLASVDIVLTVGTLLWALYAIYHYASWVSFVNIPYALWGIFATILQLTITMANRKN